MTITVPLKHVIEILNLEDNNDIKSQLKSLYSDMNIEIQEDNLIITIDDIHTLNSESYNRLIKLCDTGKFVKALDFAEELYPDYKQSSELNRIIAQIHLSNNNLKASHDYLIEALKLNPKNTNALILMGNLQYQKKELDTALMYWDSALRFNPDDYLALSNIGSLLAKQNQLKQAKNFFEESLKINEKFSNALHGLALVYYDQEEFNKAFKYAIKTLKNTLLKDEVYNNSYNLLIEIAKQLTKQNLAHVESDIHKLKDKLIEKSRKPIDIEVSDSIDTLAKLEVAEYHNRNQHKLIYKKQDLTVPHLILHELYHLHFITEAREIKNNHLFTTTQSHLERFLKKLDNFKKGLIKKGIPTENVDNLINSLFSGLNSQIFNTPIDLFIEQRIYNDYPSARPIQLLSLLRIIKDGIKATTDKEIVGLMPKGIISKSKILNMVNALWYKDYYGIDLLADFKSNKLERNQAEEFYKEYLEYARDKEPSEEYELIQHWSEDLNINDLFELKKENSDSSKTANEVIDEVNKDPYGLNDVEPTEVIENRKAFIESHSNNDVNSAVVMYMVGALKFFENFSKEEIKKIAFEFATLGMTGIDPKKSNYDVPSINKKMSGYQALSYYYVSWALAIPEMLSQLGMPFDEEYNLAQQALKN